MPRSETADRRKESTTTRVKVDGKVTEIRDFDPEVMAKRLAAKRNNKLTAEDRRKWQEATEFKNEFQ